MPGLAEMRRNNFQFSVLTSTISLDLLQATNTELPSRDGWAQVGEHEPSPGLGGSIPWPPASFMTGMFMERCRSVVIIGAPSIPISLPFVKTKCLVTFSERVSISTSMSSIMQAEYCFVPSVFKRDPCGIVQV